MGLEGITSILSSPHLGRLTHLAVDILKVSPGGVAALGSSALLPQLENVEMGAGTLTHGDASALVGDAFLGFSDVSLMAPFLTEEAGAAFATWRGLEMVTSLELIGGWNHFEDGAILEAFLRGTADAPPRPALRRLSFRDCQLGTRGMATLAELTTAIFPGLETLAILDDAIGDEGAEIVAAWPGLASLRSLSIRDAKLSPRGARAIASSPFLANLRELDLSGNHFGGEGVAALLRSKALPHLRSLVVSSCCGDEHDAVVVAEALAETQIALELFSFTWNTLDHAGATALGRALAQARVRTLDVSFVHRLDPFGAATLTRGMAASGGVVVFEEDVKLAEPSTEELRSAGGLRAYLDALQTALRDLPGGVLLRELSLWRHDLGPKDAAVLAHHPVVASVRRLGIGGNPLGPAGAHALAASPWLRQLDELALTDTGIGQAGLAALLASPVVTTLAELSIDGIGLDDEGAVFLASQAHRLPALGELRVGDEAIGEAGYAVIRRAFPDSEVRLGHLEPRAITVVETCSWGAAMV